MDHEILQAPLLGSAAGDAAAEPAPGVAPPRAGFYGSLLDLSIVIPVYNEVESVHLMHRQLTEALSRLDRSYEVIYVDDGSTDGTFNVLRMLQATDPHVRVIRFRRNYGQTPAMSAGFEHAAGAVIVTMDGDLQNDPNDIPRLLERIDEGWDIASGWRAHRRDPLVTRTLPSRAANGLISLVSGVRLHDHGCTLKAYRADVLKNLRLYGDMHRFIPAVAASVGATVVEVPVHHHPRRFGKSKYGLSRIFKVALDLILLKFLLTYATRPLRIFGVAGMVTFALGLLVTSYLSFIKLVLGHPIGGRPLLMLGVLLLMLGVQLISMGLLGELLVRIYHESQRKPIYVVRDALGWQTAASGRASGVAEARDR